MKISPVSSAKALRGGYNAEVIIWTVTDDGSDQPLFAEDPSAEVEAIAGRIGKAKGPPWDWMPNRKQKELRASDLDSLPPQAHRARMAWGYVERQNLAGLYGGIKAVEGGA